MVDVAETLIRNWEYERLSPNYNPLTMINRLSDILEVEITENFSDLMGLYNKWIFLPESEFYHVLLDEYIQRSLHCNRNLDTLDLQTASVRLLLCIAYVSNIRYNNYSNVVPSLVKWTTEAPEPLQTYSTALLHVFVKNQNKMSPYKSVGEELLKRLMERLVSNHVPSKYESNIVWQLTPLTEVMKQIFLFRLLSTWADHKIHIPILVESNAFSVMMQCIDGSNESRIGLITATRSYLSKLLTKSEFALKFVDDDGVQILIRNMPEEVTLITSRCLKNLSMNEVAMEHLCLTRPQVAQDLALCVLKLLENSTYVVRCNAMVFFGFGFSYRAILNVFDDNDGLQKVYNLFSEILKEEWSDLGLVFVACKSYTEAHLLLKYNELSESKKSLSVLKTTEEEIMDINDKMLKLVPFDWKVMNEIWKMGFPVALLKIVNYRYYLYVDEDKLQCALDILAICCLIPEVRNMLCQQKEFLSKPTSGIEDILNSTNSDNDHVLGLDTTNDIQKSALRVLVNCLSVPIIENGDNSLIKDSWNKLRECDGILMLSELLNPHHLASKEVKFLACKALCGLARDNDVKSIICKMPIYKNKYLQYLIDSEIDLSTEHATNLLKLVESMEERIPLDCAKPKNVLVRLNRRETWSEKMGSRSDKRLKYTKYRSIPNDYWSERKCGFKFTCIKIMLHQNHMIVCDNEGAIKQFDIDSGKEENSFNTECPCDYIDFERTGTVMLTSCWKGSALRSIGNFGNRIFQLEYDKYVQFANRNQKRILASRKYQATIIDAHTGIDLVKMKPYYKNNYPVFKAVYSPDDKQILFDGVMFDGNTGGYIFKFEKFNKVQNGIFHPNGYEVIMNEEIWDLRTRKLINTVPTLNYKRVTFAQTDNIMYASPLKNTNSNVLYIMDTGSYDVISTKEVIGDISEFEVNKRNTIIAVATHNGPHMESVVKLYYPGLPEIE